MPEATAPMPAATFAWPLPPPSAERSTPKFVLVNSDDGLTRDSSPFSWRQRPGPALCQPSGRAGAVVRRLTWPVERNLFSIESFPCLCAKVAVHTSKCV